MLIHWLVSIELLWLALLILFYRTIFANTATVAEWKEAEYLFFLGCYYALEGLMETLFLSNCTEFAELVPLQTITTSSGSGGGRLYVLYIARGYHGRLRP